MLSAPKTATTPQQALQSMKFTVHTTSRGEQYGLCPVPSDEGRLEFVKLEPGQYAPHIHDGVDAHIRVMNGNGLIILDGQEQPYAVGSHFNIPRGTSHGFDVRELTILFSAQTRAILDQVGNADLRYPKGSPPPVADVGDLKLTTMA